MEDKKTIGNKAYLIGYSAFLDGKMLIPVHSKELTELIKGQKCEAGKAIFIYRAWQKGYLAASAKLTDDLIAMNKERLKSEWHRLCNGIYAHNHFSGQLKKEKEARLKIVESMLK